MIAELEQKRLNLLDELNAVEARLRSLGWTRTGGGGAPFYHERLVETFASGPLTIAQVAKRWKKHKVTVATSLERAYRSGLVKRKRLENRSWLYSIERPEQ